LLSPEVRTRLKTAQLTQASYRPNAEVSVLLKETSLVMLVGPAAISKSFVMNRISEIDKEFQRVPVLTTREPRPDDESGMFRTLAHDDKNVSAILDQIDRGELVQYAIHPTSGRIYATAVEDYAGTFNLLATLSGAVGQLQSLPFKGTHVIGLTAKPETWKYRFKKRYPQPSEEKTKRLREAKTSLKWLLAQRGIIWIDNSSDDHTAAQRIIGSVKYNEQSSADSARYARRALAYIEELI